MRSIEDKSCYSHSSASEGTPNANQPGIESHKGGGERATNQHRKGLGSVTKPTPSKWDDAQKWLAGLSRVGGDHGHGKNKPRNSNAEDRRLITSAAQKGRDSCASTDEGLEVIGFDVPCQEEGETKKIDCGTESIWRINKPVEDSLPAVRSVCVRDMGTEMTPVASLEPSRTATPIRAGTPSMRSPISSRSSTPGRARQGVQPVESYPTGVSSLEGRSEGGWVSRECKDSSEHHENGRVEGEKKASSLESRAMAWDEAERAKYMARLFNIPCAALLQSRV